MPINSRQKGSRAERQAAKLMEEVTGLRWRRGQQVKGTAESPDIECESPYVNKLIQVEVKHVQNLSIYAAHEQAIQDAEGSEVRKIPVVLCKKNNKPWLMCILPEDAAHFWHVIDAGIQSVASGEDKPLW